MQCGHPQGPRASVALFIGIQLESAVVFGPAVRQKGPRYIKNVNNDNLICHESSFSAENLKMLPLPIVSLDLPLADSLVVNGAGRDIRRLSLSIITRLMVPGIQGIYNHVPINSS